MRHVLHIITALPVGGAQSQLFEIVRHRAALGLEMSVVSLADRGPMGERLAAEGVPVRALGMRPRRANLGALRHLVRLIGELQPEIVQTWLYHGDLVGGIAARLAGVRRVYWNIRQTDLSSAACRYTTRWVARGCALLSARIPDAIVCNSEAARRLHVDFGYAPDRLRLIDNGVDIARFRPDPTAGPGLRRELSLPAATRLVGLAARYHPHKDHAGFLAAAAALARDRADVAFVLCGEEVTAANAPLRELVRGYGLGDRVHLLGARADMPRLVAAFDLAVSASYTEGSPNALIEAMAAATPCLATAVGDSARVIGTTGWIVPPGDPVALAGALATALALPTGELARRGDASRRRVQDAFSLDAMLAAYGRLYGAGPSCAATPAASTSRP